VMFGGLFPLGGGGAPCVCVCGSVCVGGGVLGDKV